MIYAKTKKNSLFFYEVYTLSAKKNAIFLSILTQFLARLKLCYFSLLGDIMAPIHKNVEEVGAGWYFL